MISTKLHGRWRLSNCHLRIPSHASLQAPGEPGRPLDQPGADLGAGNAAEAQVVILGYDPLVWESRFVALLPGIGWLPATVVPGVPPMPMP